jgi:sRNA-binding regulator protein Hfq
VEAISTVKEDIEGNVLNYMLYFVMVRSQDFDNMEYKHLISLLDALLENQSRVQSTTRKNRPESSSPEKLKMRNHTKSNMSVPLNADGDDNDNYSEEEIADDPDEGDSQNELGKP